MSKFKCIERAIRQTLNSLNKVTDEINLSLEGRRTDDEKELLKAVGDDWNELHKQAFGLTADFVGRVDN